MAPHSSTLAWRIPGTGEPGWLPSMGSLRVRHDWSDLIAAAAGIRKHFAYRVNKNSSMAPSAILPHFWGYKKIWLCLKWLKYSRIFSFKTHCMKNKNALSRGYSISRKDMGPSAMDDISHFNLSKGNTIYAATKIKPVSFSSVQFSSVARLEPFKYNQFRRLLQVNTGAKDTSSRWISNILKYGDSLWQMSNQRN